MRLHRYLGMSALALAAAWGAAAQSPSNDVRANAAALRTQAAPIVITNKNSRAGNLGATAADRMRQREERAKYLQQLSKQRSSGSTRTRGLAVYQPKDGGTPVLTNRITKYEALKKDFRRIKINYDPIVKPDRWGPTTGRYADTDIHKYVDYYAQRYNLDSSLVHAIIHVESRGNPYAVSPKGASGLMQLMPGTAADLKVANVFDPAENIGGGTQYISKLLGLFKGNYALALAGYNAGPETVRQYGGIPPYRETQNYVDSVQYYWNYFKANGNSFAYKKFDAELTPTAIAARRKARYETREVGDLSKPSHEVTLADGAVHSADKVSHQGDYLYLVAGGRTVRLGNKMVLAVDGVAFDPETYLSLRELGEVPDATVPLPKGESVRLAAQI